MSGRRREGRVSGCYTYYVRDRRKTSFATVLLRTLPSLALLVVSASQALQPLSCLQDHKELRTDRERFSELFPFADSDRLLLTFNNDYVLQPHYGTDGAIWIIEVVPKYVFEETHPKWTEPDTLPFLDRSTYRDLLSQIEKVKSLGRLQYEDPGSTYVTNRQFPAIDAYDNGAITASPPASSLPASEAASACHRSIEKFTVPSTEGGTSEITIMRC